MERRLREVALLIHPSTRQHSAINHGAEFVISLDGQPGGEGRDDLLANYLLLAIGSSLQFITT